MQQYKSKVDDVAREEEKVLLFSKIR